MAAADMQINLSGWEAYIVVERLRFNRASETGELMRLSFFNSKTMLKSNEMSLMHSDSQNLQFCSASHLGYKPTKRGDNDV